MFYLPMLLETAEKPFCSGEFIMEPKLDGHRLLFEHENGKSQLWTRHSTPVTKQYPELSDLHIDGDALLDGEACSTDPDSGQVDFEAVMERFQLKNEHKIKRAALTRPINYIVWDILYYKRDLRKLPLTERRKILEQVLPPHPLIRIVPQVDGTHGESLYQLIENQKLEGIVAKKKNSRYVSRRSSDWLKVIRWEYAVATISGFDKLEFGWLAAVEENGVYRSAGTIRLGTGPSQRKSFMEFARKHVTSENKQYVYVEPKLKVLVKFRNWTRNGLLRDPVFVQFM